MNDPEGGIIDLGLVVSIDTEVTPELAAEGPGARRVRLVQQTRKDLDLDIIERIDLRVAGPARILDAVRAHRSTVEQAVLATSLVLEDLEASPPTATLDGEDIAISVSRIA